MEGRVSGQRWWRALSLRGKDSAETAILLVSMAGVAAAVYARTVGLAAPPYGGDERYIVLHALKFGTGDLNPHFFDWPASPLMYASFLSYGAYYALGRIAGWFHSTEAFGLAALFTPTAFYLVPRLISACCGIVTAIAVWRGLSPVTGWAGRGFAAAIVLAAPTHTEFSRLGLADVPMTAAVAWVAAIAIQLATGAGGWRLGAALVGLAMSLKYQGALSAVPLAAGLIVGLRGTPAWPRVVAIRLGIMTGIALGTFFLLTPFALLDVGGFVADLRFQVEHQAGGVVHYGAMYPAHPLKTMLGTVLPAAFGWTAIAGAACGLIVGLVSKSYRVVAVLATGVVVLHSPF
jgi:hypothetical protein